MRKKLLIIIPVYNEQEAIGSLLDEMVERNMDELGDILVINDGSTDHTQRIVEEKQIKIINKPFNLGYGSTLQLGYKYAVSNDYEYVIQIDGDGQHDLSNINVVYEALVESAAQPDIVIGSRFLSEDNKMHTSKLKKIAIAFFRKIIKLFTKQTITDPTSGLQGLNRSAFTFYSAYGNFDYQYPDINMIIQMLLMGYQIKEVPARMYDRKTGESMHSGIFKPILYMVLISLSTVSILIRQRENYYQLREREDAESVKPELSWQQLSIRRYTTLTAVIVLLLVMIFFVMDLESFVRGRETAFEQETAVELQEVSATDFVNQEDVSEDTLMIEGSELDTSEDVEQLEELLEAEKTLVFLSLPTQEFIEEYGLMEMLGIREIFGQHTQKELNLIDGFMLGGAHQFADLVYDTLDLDLSFSTKVYGYGKRTPSKSYPIIWRNTYQDSEVYVVNGPFMQTDASYGLAAAIMAEIEEDYIYPIVNARLMLYESFPYVSDKNKEELEEKYNRDAMKVQHDILFPDLLSINKLRGFIPNGFFRLGFEEEIKEIQAFEQRQLTMYKEQVFKDGGEVGLRYSGDIEQDQKDYQQVFDDAPIKSVLIQEETTDAEIDEILETIDSVEAILGPFRKEKNYRYLNDQAIYLPFTSEGFEQSGQAELEFVSMVTAFGTVVHNLDVEEVIDPADGKEKWTGGHKAYVQFLDKYREPFIFLKDRNVTDTAIELKTLLNNIPAIRQNANKIELSFPKEHEETYYMLRTKKKVNSVKNGTFKKIEKDVYLIKAKGQRVEVKVE